MIGSISTDAIPDSRAEARLPGTQEAGDSSDEGEASHP